MPNPSRPFLPSRLHLAAMALALCACPALAAPPTPTVHPWIRERIGTPETRTLVETPRAPKEELLAYTAAFPSRGIGEKCVVAMSNASIKIFDPVTGIATGPFLEGQLGSAGGGLFDVVITPDMKTAIVSNFGDSTIYFVDVSTPASPSVKGSVTVGAFAEDIALTRDGQYALVTDGGFSSWAAVIHVPSMTLLADLDLQSGEDSLYANAVAIAPDGRTVLCADFFGGNIHVFTFDPAVPSLTWVASHSTMPYRPVNVSISHDGRTAMAAVYAGDPDLSPNCIVPTFRIAGPGMVVPTGAIALPAGTRDIQSIDFDWNQQQAYALGSYYLEEEKNHQEALPSFAPPPADPCNAVHVLNLGQPGTVTHSGRVIPVDFAGTSALFGVDTLASSPGFRQNLVVSHKTISGARPHIQVINLKTYFIKATVDLAYTDDDDNYAVPVGVGFRSYPSAYIH